MTDLHTSDTLDALSFAIFRVHGALIAMGDRIGAPYGLTSARWQVMGTVQLAGQPQTVAQIARAMGLSRQAVQRVMNDLEVIGMIEMQDNPAHKRARLVVNSPAGLRAYEQIMAEWARLSRSLMEALPAEKLEDSSATLDALTRALLALGPPPD
ncbi:MAG: MarR family winged helix-turn-helix transcriptional regulator [Proteobacteria bacterium]|nr:MarR family winged helix-turn-helix transcriptional regulator [Pseudomonadota bacterium]